ncbi:MAG: hypothetical protein Q8O41_02925 [Candidatus Methanoperedens sp.]|nr:hypothetical protein [Candidatus Methanoperedens sp.]
MSNRLGLVNTKTPEDTEIRLREILPEKHWRIINELLVRFGQDICRPIAPKCRACPIIELCPSSKQSK